MKAHIVLGSQFGDEGKGVVTDHLCSLFQRDSVVVRFSGGQQAGHTVIRNGIKHIFASFGSGTLLGVPTYISEYCTFYPPNLLNEYLTLNMKGIYPSIFFHPKAMCTTPFDVAYNRWKERKAKHGSCGIGVGATVKRNIETPYKFYATDLIYPLLITKKFKVIEKYYINLIKSKMGTEEDVASFMSIVSSEMRNFMQSLSDIYNVLKLQISYNYLQKFKNIIFEGSQGIMLDMDHGIFPNVTYSHTTSKNAMEICNMLGISRRDTSVNYVTRCYQTRHGNGWMSNKNPVNLIANSEEINVKNEWQGEFRVSELDYKLLNYAIMCDSYSWGCYKNLIITCLDQRPDFKFIPERIGINFHSILKNFSPVSGSIEKF